MSQYQQPQPRPDLPYPGQQPQAPLKSSRTTAVAIIAGIVGALVGAGVTGAAMSGDPTAKAPTSVSSQATTPPDNGPTPDPITTPTNQPTTTEPPAPAYGTPTKADFKLTVKVLTKQCFGSAGCNLTYRLLVSYGGAELDPSVTYEVLYQVKGGEDGPVDNKLTVTGTQSSVDEEEYVSTKSSKTKLTAVVTDVLSQ